MDDKFPYSKVFITGSTGIVGRKILEELSKLRDNIRYKALNSPLFDTKRFNENFIKKINRLF